MAVKLMYDIPGFFENRPKKILEVCNLLAPIMNEVHGKAYSTRFWTTLLKYHVTTMINRETLLSQKVLEEKPYLLPINSWENPGQKKANQKKLQYLGKALKNRTGLKKTLAIIENNRNICLGSRGKELERFGVGTYCPSYYPVLFSSQKKMRARANKIAKKQPDIFMENVIRQIPKFYLEFFPSLLKKIKLFTPQEKTFHAEHISPFMEMMVALYVEHGAKYYNYQLGGFIGETLHSVNPSFYATIDKRRTYGWKIHEKDEPHYAYRLEEFKRQYNRYHQKKETDILICFSLVNAKTKNPYKTITEKFFNGVDTEKYPKILLRPRGVTRKINNQKQLAFIDIPSSVKIDKGMKSMAEVMKPSRLVVHLEHPSTNFLECIYVDHPVAAILNNEFPTDIIKPFYKFFLEQKILHKDLDSLIEHLNEADIEKWWKGVVALPMYKKFKETFAKAPR